MEDLNDINYSDAIDLDIALIGVSNNNLANNTIIKDITLSKESMEEFLKHIYFAEKTPDTTYTMECVDIKCNQPEPYKSKSGDWRKKSKKHKGGNMFHK